MRQISRHVGHMILVLLGAIIQIGITSIANSLGTRYADDMISFLLSFLGVLTVSIIVSAVLFIANWLSGKTNIPNATAQLSIYNRAIESRSAAIQALRCKLSATENELNLIKRSFSELESSVRSLQTERDALKQSNRRLEIKLKKER